MNVDHLSVEELRSRANTGCPHAIYRLGVVMAGGVYGEQLTGNDAYNSTLPTFEEAVRKASFDFPVVKVKKQFDMINAMRLIGQAIIRRDYFFSCNYGQDSIAYHLFSEKDPKLRGGCWFTFSDLKNADESNMLKLLISSRIGHTIHTIEDDNNNDSSSQSE